MSNTNTKFSKETFIQLCVLLMNDASTEDVGMDVIDSMLYGYASSTNMPHIIDNVRTDKWSKFIDDLSTHNLKLNIQNLYEEHFEGVVFMPFAPILDMQEYARNVLGI